jgi:nitrate/TMAO reductase-like tetraheme cytochrome c subunit
MKLIEKFVMAIMLAIAVFFAHATIQIVMAKSVLQPTNPTEFVVSSTSNTIKLKENL